MEQLSLTDPLTSLHNRRYLDRHFPVWLEFASQQNVPLAAFIIDVDHFKKINDALWALDRGSMSNSGSGEYRSHRARQNIEKAHWEWEGKHVPMKRSTLPNNQGGIGL